MGSATSYNEGFLTVNQNFGADPASVFEGQYDVALVVPSWDPRSVALTNSSLRSKVAVVPLLKNRGVTGSRRSNEDRLLTYLHANSDEVRTLEADSEDVESTFDAVFGAIENTVKRLDRPVRLLVELSTCPRYLSLGVAALLLRRGWAYEICFLYTAAEYGDAPETDPLADIFTFGRWDTIAVPGLEGWHDPGRRRSYVVAVGFEGAKTYRLLSSADPDRVALLFPDPGVVREYVARAADENSEVLAQFVASDAAVVRAGAADVVGSLSALDAAGLEDLDDENVFYLTCGSKPQSLALALRAFYLEAPALLYPVPQRHKESTVRALPMHWSYRVRDRSALTSGA
jgi:hypothetical protein